MILAAAAAGGIGLFAWRSVGQSTSKPFVTQGIVEFDERVLSFELPGRIVALPATRGDHVQAGALLAQIDDSVEQATRATRAGEAAAAQAQAALTQAGARVEDIRSMAARVRAAKATEELLKLNAAREQSLFERHAIAKASLDDIRGQLDRAVAERQALEQNLAALQRGSRSEEVQGAEARAAAASSALKLEDVRLARHELYATHEGTVLDVHVEAGEVVAVGTPIATLADTHRPYVDVFVPQAELGRVHLGQAADVRLDALREAVPGKVEYIARKTEFTPRFLFSERERPNLVVRVRVRVSEPKQELYAGVPAFVTFPESDRR